MQSIDHFEKEKDTKLSLKRNRITMENTKPFRDEETKAYVLNPRITIEKLQKPKKIYRETKNKTFLDKKDEELR